MSCLQITIINKTSNEHKPLSYQLPKRRLIDQTSSIKNRRLSTKTRSVSLTTNPNLLTRYKKIINSSDSLIQVANDIWGDSGHLGNKFNQRNWVVDESISGKMGMLGLRGNYHYLLWEYWWGLCNGVFIGSVMILFDWIVSGICDFLLWIQFRIFLLNTLTLFCRVQYYYEI